MISITVYQFVTNKSTSFTSKLLKNTKKIKKFRRMTVSQTPKPYLNW